MEPKVGARAEIVREGHPHHGQVGEVTAVEEEAGRAILFCPELGHVREGKGVNGLSVRFEDLRVFLERAEEGAAPTVLQ